MTDEVKDEVVEEGNAEYEEEAEEGSEEGSELAVVNTEPLPIDDCEHSELRKQILELRDRSEENTWALSELLYRVYEEGLYQAWGFISWHDYADQEMGYSKRTAQVHVQIQTWLAKMPANIREWIREIGYSKARLLVRRVTVDNAAEWRNLIEGKTVAEIEKMISDSKDESVDEDGDGEGSSSSSSGSKSSEKTKRRSFALYPEQDKNVVMALGKAKEMANSEKDGNALDLICTEFLSGNAGIDSLEEYLRSVERNIGLQLVAWDAAQNDVVYGQDFLAAMGDAEGEDGSEGDTGDSEASEDDPENADYEDENPVEE